jgi:RNA methyltransferase, TrmH family
MPLSQSKIKEYAKLKQKKFRTLKKQFIVEGVRGITDLIASLSVEGWIESVLHTPDFVQNDRREKLIISLIESGAKNYEVDKKTLDKLAVTVTGQNIIAVVNQWSTPIEAVLHRTDPQLIVAVDRIREPGNLGALIRTCDWFGVDALLLGKDTVEIWNPKVVRSSVGSMTNVTFVEDVDLIVQLEKLKDAGYIIAGTDVRSGVSVAESPPEKPCVIVFGNEADGISLDIRDQVNTMITIPRFGKAESLNVGIAAGIILSVIRFTEIKRDKSEP